MSQRAEIDVDLELEECRRFAEVPLLDGFVFLVLPVPFCSTNKTALGDREVCSQGNAGIEHNGRQPRKSGKELGKQFLPF